MTKPMMGPNSPSGNMTSLKYFTAGPSLLQARLLVNVMSCHDSTWQGATVVRGSRNDSTKILGDTSKIANNDQVDVPVLQKHITVSSRMPVAFLACALRSSS